MPRRRRRVTQYEAAPPPPPPPTGHYVQEEVVTPPPRRPLLWPWLVLLLVLVAAGIVGAYLLTRDNGSKTRVPNVVGLSAGAAVRALGQKGYPAVVQSQVASGARVGTVLSENPPAGTKLDRGKQVTIVVARGPTDVDVPNVVGLSLAQALVRLQAAKLAGRPVQVASPQPKGRVIKQVPAGGTQAKKGSTVVLTVSKGPALVAVPNVTGRTEATATATLTRLGFKVRVSRVPSTQPQGMVISQQPPAATKAPKGSIVGLNVSTGPTTTTTTTPTTTGTTTGQPPPAGTAIVPKVVGMGQLAAVSRIEGAGLRVDSYPIASSKPRGTVVSQQPTGGTHVQAQSKVRINVSLGPGQRPNRVVPDVVGQDESAARRTLINVGFTVRTVDQPNTDPAQANLVQTEQPAAGQSVPAGSQVVIYVARPPSPSG